MLGSGLFPGGAQVDVVTVLMLLGEAAIGKVIWARFRSRRVHWKHWVFAVSPGWTTLAASLFAAINGSLHAPNLIFDRVPENTLDGRLILTNLNSGASHAATNVIIQNIWQTWNGGPRVQQRRSGARRPFDITREVGLVDVNIDKLRLENPFSWWLQVVCLLAQVFGSLLLGGLTGTLEPFLVLLVAFVGQSLLIVSIIPRAETWHMATRGHRPCPVMLHRGLDSMGALFIRRVQMNGREISLEEFCWDSQIPRTGSDNLKLAIAGFAFLVLTAQIILVGLMDQSGRHFYLVFGSLGVLANTIEAASPPRWLIAFVSSFSGNALCAPDRGSLMSAVAILQAGRFPAAIQSAKLLYPDNSRFALSLRDLEQILNDILCDDCRQIIRCSRPLSSNREHRCHWQTTKEKRICPEQLATRIHEIDAKQIKDGMATICHYLRSVSGDNGRPPMDTFQRFEDIVRHTW